MNSKILELVPKTKECYNKMKELNDKYTREAEDIIGYGFTPQYLDLKIQLRVTEVDPECEYAFSSSDTDFFYGDVDGVKIVECIDQSISLYMGERHE